MLSIASRKKADALYTGIKTDIDGTTLLSMKEVKDHLFSVLLF
jgi:hypothetical protein